MNSRPFKTLLPALVSVVVPGGYCANGIAYGIPWGGHADTWKMIGDKL